MNGTKRSNIKIGATVIVVQKQDQRTGKLIEGIVKNDTYQFSTTSSWEYQWR